MLLESGEEQGKMDTIGEDIAGMGLSIVGASLQSSWVFFEASM